MSNTPFIIASNKEGKIIIPHQTAAQIKAIFKMCGALTGFCMYVSISSILTKIRNYNVVIK